MMNWARDYYNMLSPPLSPLLHAKRETRKRRRKNQGMGEKKEIISY